MIDATFHVLGLAHQPVTTLVPSCAYTLKTVNMAKMLRANGNKVVLYHAGSFKAPAIADDYVQVVDDSTMERLYGLKFYETYNQNWDQGDEAWKQFRRKAAQAISSRLSPDGIDVVLASFGTAHEACCPPTAAALTIEMGVGYEGVFAARKVWESYAWQSYMQGQLKGSLSLDRDVVIPNYIDPTAFEFRDGPREPWALYMGRVIQSKGVLQAKEACRLAGIPLKVAGKGDPQWIKDNLDGVEYLGMVNKKGRRELLGRASALMCMTQYFEPFGGVAVEAAYSGLPVVSSDHGAFPETVIEGVTGYRVRDIYQAATALKQIDRIKQADCHEWGKRFTLQAVWPRYERYFRHQISLFKKETQ